MSFSFLLFESAGFGHDCAEGGKIARKTATYHGFIEEESHRPFGGGLTKTTQHGYTRVKARYVSPPYRKGHHRKAEGFRIAWHPASLRLPGLVPCQGENRAAIPQ